MARAVSAGEAAFRLRPDLRVGGWDAADDGKPRWIVHDPVTGGLGVISWPESLLLPGLRRGATAAELCRAVARESALRPGETEILDYIGRLDARGWLVGPVFPRVFRPERGESLATWLFHRYLYARITLFHPDAWLARTLPAARVLGYAVAAAAMVLAVAGLYLALPRWEDFLAGAVGLVEWRNLPWMLPAVALVKFVHEFAHAYAAKACGARVDGMGVALVTLLPLPFVNVTDAWRLSGRERFRVAAAGLLAELCVAAFALPAWALSPPGRGRDLCLVLGTTVLVSSLLTNLNPGMRFDGYYMLSHLLGVENLRARADALFIAGWRRLCWGLAEPDSEPGLGRRKRTSMALYAVYARLYRLVLFSTLALAIYRRLPALFGIAMFAAIWWSLIMRPALGELAALWRKRGDMGWRAAITCAVVLGLSVWAGLELPRRASLPAVVRLREAAVVAAVSGEIDRVATGRGETVGRGETLARIRRLETETARIRAEWSAAEARLLADSAWLSGDGRPRLRAAEARAAAADVASRAWERREEVSVVSAAADGVVESWEPWVREGVYVPRGAVLGRIRHPGRPMVTALVAAADAGRYEPGQRAEFYPSSGGPALAGTVLRIVPQRVDSLDDGALAQAAGGTWDGRVWRLPGAMQRMLVEVDREYARSGQEGVLWLETRPYSLVREAWRWCKGLVVRESGL